jgi:hypothetical protein
MPRKEAKMGSVQLKRALRHAGEIGLAVTGRRSGREISIPVWFVAEGDELFLLPVNGTDADWYRNVLKTPAIRIAVDGVETTASAKPITDSAKVNEVVEKFRSKYGAADVARYYRKLDAAVQVPLD